MSDQTVFRPKRILCPMDFSELSDLALKYAVAGAQEFNAELTVLHAHYFEVPRYFIPDNAEKISRELNKEKNYIRNSVVEHVKKIVGPMASDIEMKFKVMDHHPVESIMTSIKKGAGELVVMGTHGLGGFKRILLGSITERIVRESPVPVFTIRQKVHDFIESQDTEIISRIQRVLCPCKLAETSRKALEVAVSIADFSKAMLTILYIRDEGEVVEREAVQERVCALWGDDILNQPCPVEIKVRQGNSAEEIVKQASEFREDVIVLSAVHKSFLDDTFLGRTTELVMRHAPSPVLIVPV